MKDKSHQLEKINKFGYCQRKTKEENKHDDRKGRQKKGRKEAKSERRRKARYSTAILYCHEVKI